MKQAKEEQNNNIHHHAMLVAKKAGLEGVISLEPINSGGNNRVFKMSMGEKIFLLKAYFHSDKDLRDRLGHEFAFTSFAWEHGVQTVPRPVACDHAHFLGLYEFIDGKKLGSGEVTLGHVSQALNFFLELNRHKEEPNASALPIASEACFSVSEHLSCVDRRLKQLREVNPCDTTDTEAADFIHDELSPCWEKVREGVVRLARGLRIEMDENIPLEECCLSPSDFGFHNTILARTGELRFIDFEYAGWDDPAKMVCDFFCQPEVVAPLGYFNRFLHEIHMSVSEPEYFEDRVNMLFPVHRIKWCCIMLNDFTEVGNIRRKFVGSCEPHERKKKQFEKAQRYFSDFLELLRGPKHFQTLECGIEF